MSRVPVRQAWARRQISAPIAVLFLCRLLNLEEAYAQTPKLFEPHEEQLIERTLAARQLVVDPAPDGKQIEAIHIAAHPVIVPGDLPLNRKLPWTALNRLHVRTRDYIIEQELLLGRGSRYDSELAAESERNLRSLSILTVARLVAVRGSAVDRVAILVVTKDRWTFRPSAPNFFAANAFVDKMNLMLLETNLAGRAKQASIQFAIEPDRFALGVGYYDPRVQRSRHFVRIEGSLYLSRDSHQLEGRQLKLSVGRPLFSLHTRLAWQTDLTYLDDIKRSFQGPTPRRTPFAGEELPEVYTRRNIMGNLQLTYSNGIAIKTNFTAGLRAVHNVYGLPADFPAASQRALAAYRAWMPRSESWAGPIVALEVFTTKFIKLKNIDTFALTEDFRLGPRLLVEIRIATHLLGLPADFFELAASYNHQHYARDNLMDCGASITGRTQHGVSLNARDSLPVVNETLTLYLREVTPRLGPVRLFLYGVVQLRAHDRDNVQLTLGSDNGLRGFGPRTFEGRNLYRINAELRTVPLNFWSIHTGLALFYDAGYTPTDEKVLQLHQSAGFGLRILFPQIQRGVLRLDLSFPFEVGENGYKPTFSVGFGPAF